jgi:pantothenate kinase
VEGDGKFERVSGTSIGGGTFWGLGKLLTKCKRLFIYLIILRAYNHYLFYIYS